MHQLTAKDATFDCVWFPPLFIYFRLFFQGNGNPVLLWREVSPIAGELGKGVLLTRSKHLLKTSEWNLKSS